MHYFIGFLTSISSIFKGISPLGVREGSQACEGNLFPFSCLVYVCHHTKRGTLLWLYILKSDQ